ncbi:MAG: radical SAM family heme chaperone HemW [Treponema sp.]|nr:radical SAM family heme chaperone HemW [Treponema sp.]
MRPPLYVHIPYCLKKCGYCDFFSKPSARVPTEYVKAAARQIEFLSREFRVEEWKSVYIGGGTPSLMGAEDLEFLCKAIKAAAPLASDCEWTIEMNPGSISAELLEAARSFGINRLSLGIQCKNQKVLDAIERRATVAQIEEAASLAKNIWAASWSADLIAGLPFQTKEDIARDIDFIERNGTNHISLYSLTLEEGTPLAKKIERGEMPYDEEAAEELWLYGRDLLEARGYLQYEVSNFAKAGFESKHNAAYWAQESYLGAGAGATGTIYGNPTGCRYTNVLDAAKYIEHWNGSAKQKGFNGPNAGARQFDFPCQLESLDMDTQEFEYIMTNLRTKRGAGASEYKARYGKDLAARLGHSKWLEKIERDGEAFYAMTREGLLFLNKFLEEL